MKIEDYFKYYIQGSDHYLIPKDEFIELFNEMVNWKEESQKKKEVIDKTIDYNKFNTYGERLGKVLFLDNCYMHLYNEVEIIKESKREKKED